MVAITVRNVPEQTRDVLAARAATRGQSLQEYLRSQLIELARRPDPEDFWARVRERKRQMGTRLPAGQVLEYLERRQ